MLPQRDVGARLRRLPQRLVVRSFYDANYLEELPVLRQLEAFTECVLIWPILGGHGLVDDGHGRRNVAIILRKVSAFQKRDAHRGKIVEVHRVDDGRDGFGSLPCLLPLDRDARLLASPHRTALWGPRRGLQFWDEVSPVDFRQYLPRSFGTEFLVPLLKMIGKLLDDLRFPFRPKIQSGQMFPDCKLPFRHVVPRRFGPRLRQTLATSYVAARGRAVLPRSAGNTCVVFDSLSPPTAPRSNLVFPTGRAAGRARPRENGACLPSALR